MRTAKSLSLLAIVALTNAALIYGCSSSSDSTDPGVDQTDSGNKDATNPDAKSIVTTDATTTTTDAGVADAKADAKKDSGKDASDASDMDAPDAPVVYDPPGSPCANVNQEQDRGCTMCGTQNRVCLQADADAGDSGLPGYWSDWGDCAPSPVAECDNTKTYPDEACGNCGTRPHVCQQDCTFIPGITCSGEGACSPGDSDWQEGLGCPTPDGGQKQGRLKSCNAQCQYTVATTCTLPPPNQNSITVSNTATGTVYTKTFLMPATPLLTRPDIPFSSVPDCPLVLSTTQTIRQFIEVKNTTNNDVHVSIWQSTAANNPMSSDDTVMAVYAGASVPATDAARTACIDYPNDMCNPPTGVTFTPPACENNSAGLIKGEVTASGTFDGVLLPKNSSVTVYIAPWSASTSSGNFVLSVKVEGP